MLSLIKDNDDYDGYLHEPHQTCEIMRVLTFDLCLECLEVSHPVVCLKSGVNWLTNIVTILPCPMYSFSRRFVESVTERIACCCVTNVMLATTVNASLLHLPTSPLKSGTAQTVPPRIMMVSYNSLSA